jgi:hypothetical protein
MSTGPFPNDPCHRRAILVLQNHDIERCAYESVNSHSLLDDEAYFLEFPVPTQGEIPLPLQQILDAGLARPGRILVQSPYDADHYEDATHAPQRFALAKHMYFSTLCRHLGAKEVNVEQIDLRTRSGKCTYDVKGERLGSSAEMSVATEELEMFRSQLQLHDEFSGSQADLLAAEQLLRRTGLWADPNMRTLLEMRGDGENKLRTRKLVLSLSNEAKSNLNVAGRLKVPAFVSLSADYNRVIQEQYEYTLTVVVRF